MSEISEERAREAARIFRNAVEWTKEYGERPALSDAAKRVMDSATHASAVMSKWAIEELSRRDAAQAARQQPITPEWCLTNGAHRSAEWYWFDDGVSKGMTRYEKSPDVLNGVWSFLWMPPAVMKATLHSLSGFFNSVNTGFGVTGTKISERIPSTVVKFITTPPIVHLQPPWG